MPPSLPLWGDKRDYDMDAPITVVGSTQARLVGASPVWTWMMYYQRRCCCCILYMCIYLYMCVCALPGEALLESNTVLDFVYCSPSLRCVQTAQNILRGKRSVLEHSSGEIPSRWIETNEFNWNESCVLFFCFCFFVAELCRLVFVLPGLQQDGKLKVRVEPGLFEWTKWVSGNSLPAWIPPTDLAAAHFSVDTTYRWCRQLRVKYTSVICFYTTICWQLTVLSRVFSSQIS